MKTEIRYKRDGRSTVPSATSYVIRIDPGPVVDYAEKAMIRGIGVPIFDCA
jgi:hypothetical protein